MPEEDYGECYEEQMRKAFGERRIHIVTERVPARSLRDGMFVMYLPLEITEGADMDPQMAQVVSIERHNQMFTINTTLGKMFIKDGEAIQVVA